MSRKCCCFVVAVLTSSFLHAYTDSVWIEGAEGYPGDLATVEVWLQYEGGGHGDSMAAFDIPLRWDASVCTVEAITLGTDFIDDIGHDWTDVSRFDNTGTWGPPLVPKLCISAFNWIDEYNAPRGTHLAASVDFRILDSAAPGGSTYIDSLRTAFSPTLYFRLHDDGGTHSYLPSYAGGWVVATSLAGDVRPTSVASPPSAVFVDHTYAPSVVIRNYGPDSIGPVPVICRIDQWADTLEIVGIPGFTSITADFAGWTVPERGVYMVTVLTKYAGDPEPANDTLSVTIRAYVLGDVGPGRPASPPDTVYLGQTYVPSVTIRNFEVDSAGPVPVTCSINSWTSRVETALIPGRDSTIVNFLNWTVPDTGHYSVTMSTDYPADTNSSNDVASGDVYATFPDRVPTDSLWVIGGHGGSGELVTAAIWLQYEGGGYGDSMGSCYILLTWDAAVCSVEGFTIGTDFAEESWVEFLRVDNQGMEGPPAVPKIAICLAYAKTAGLPTVGPVPRGMHLVGNLDFRMLDSAPPGSRMYVDTLMKGFSPPLFLGFMDDADWRTYVPTYGGGWVVLPAADRDAGPTAITSPPSVVSTDSSYSVSAVIRNFGCSAISSMSVICVIDPWADTARIPVLAGLDSVVANFGEWAVPDTGAFSVTVFTQSDYDPNPLNDTLSKTVQACVEVDEIPTEPGVPLAHGLSQGYPNPMADASTISYQVAGKCELSLKIFDSTGRLIRTLVEREKGPGYYSVNWDGRNLHGERVPNGVYFVRLEAHTPGSVGTLTGFKGRDYSATRKLCVVR